MEAGKVLELLEKYERASGQTVNKSKSPIFFSANVIVYNRQMICETLQMVEADEHSQYLGLPNIIGRNKTAIFDFLREKVRGRIKSWNDRFLSRARNELLVKSVAQALPAYAMNVFLLSARHKHSGGLGFKNFRDYNIAMLGRQGWRLIVNPNSLVSQLYKARYYADTDFLHSKLGNNPSFIWRSMIEAKQLLLDGTRWRIGSGENIQILGQPWLMCDVNPFITTCSQAIENQPVASLFAINRREWDMDVIRDIFNTKDQECILQTTLLNSNVEDAVYWKLEASGEYSVKSAYKHLQQQKSNWFVQHSESCKA